MKHIFFCLISFFFFAFSSNGQSVKLSKSAEISLLTCGPSGQVHAIYGHTAIRVKDSAKRIDVVFNYGVFSFNAPYFVYRFAKGQTDYLLAAEVFADFLDDYKRNGRSIYEQILDLTQPEKQRLLDFMVENAKPENREYRYNFFYDNCATRVRDVVEKQVEGTIIFPADSGQEKTFRQHVDVYQKVLPWANFGIQLVLGSPSDKVASAYQEMFLPDFLEYHFARAQVVTNGVSRPLVKESHVVFDAGNKEKSGINLFGPFVILLVSFFLIGFISYHQYRRQQIRYWPDYILLFLTGLIGLVLLWFVTYSEHPAMHTNYNLWWAVPTNIPFMFLWMVKKWRSGLKWYWSALSIWLILFLLFNFFIPQGFHVGFYLIILMVLCRALLHSIRFISNASLK